MGKIVGVVGDRPHLMTVLESGRLLDRRYRIVQPLSKGGFGRTYVAEDTRRPGNPKCVVKHLTPASNGSIFLEHARRLFAREAETLEQLGHHDQIPRLLAYFEEDREFYLVQELVDGHPLSNELKSGRHWSENQIYQLLQDILTILVFVHSHGVIHRDIKPDNMIRRQQDGKLVLVDFGAVKQIQTQQDLSEVNSTIAVGTPGYMPTEQSYGKPRPGSDIYALGIVGIQAATGLIPARLPEDPNTGEIIWQSATEINEGLTAVLTRMVRYHFKERYQSALETLQALEDLTRQHPHLTDAVLWEPLPLMPTAPSQPVPPSPLPKLSSDIIATTPNLGTTLLSQNTDLPTDVLPSVPPSHAIHSAAPSVVEPLPPQPTIVYPPSTPAAPLPLEQPSLDNPEATVVLSGVGDQGHVPAPPHQPPLPSPDAASRLPLPKALLGVGVVMAVAAVSVALVLKNLASTAIAPPDVSNRINTSFPHLLVLGLPCQELPSLPLANPPALAGKEGAIAYVYHGAVADGRPADGRGTQIFANGDRYDGEFRDAQFNGCGTVRFNSGYIRSYIGQFQQGRFDGLGLLVWENGDRYIGEFERGKCQGKGTLITAQADKSYYGTWRNGDLTSSGVSCNKVN